MAASGNKLDELLGVSRAEDRPKSAKRTAEPLPVEAAQEAADDDGGGGGFLGIGGDKLKQILRTAVPAFVAGFAPGAGAGAFGQSFFGQTQRLDGLAREAEQKREAMRRENAQALFEMFQNAPEAFSAMDPERLLAIAEPMAEQLNVPAEEVLGIMQAQAQQAAGLNNQQQLQLGLGLAGADQFGPAQQVLQGLPGQEGLQFQGRGPEGPEDLDSDEVARIKENFTGDSADEFLAAIQRGMSRAEAGQLLEWRDPSGGRRIPALEREATRAAEMMRAGEQPDPVSMQAYNKYYASVAPGLSPATIASTVGRVTEYGALLAGIDPNNPRAKAILQDQAGVARQVLKDAEVLMRDLSPPPTQAVLDRFIEANATRRFQELGTTAAPPEEPATATAEEQAAYAKAKAELGPGASVDQIVERADEILGNED